MSNFFKNHWLGIFLSAVLAGLVSTYVYNHLSAFTSPSVAEQHQANETQSAPPGKSSRDAVKAPSGSPQRLESTDGQVSGGTSGAASGDVASTQPPTATSPKEAIIHTTAGVITLRFLADRSPEHVTRFATLAREGFYDTIQFRRVVPGVLVEANYRSDNPPPTAYQHPELSDVPFRRGIVGISTAGNPLREGWQFFILTADAPYMNGLYTPIAEVQEGMEVVDSIAQAASASRWQWILSVDLR